MVKALKDKASPTLIFSRLHIICFVFFLKLQSYILLGHQCQTVLATPRYFGASGMVLQRNSLFRWNRYCCFIVRIIWSIHKSTLLYIRVIIHTYISNSYPYIFASIIHIHIHIYIYIYIYVWYELVKTTSLMRGRTWPPQWSLLRSLTWPIHPSRRGVDGKRYISKQRLSDVKGNLYIQYYIFFVEIFRLLYKVLTIALWKLWVTGGFRFAFGYLWVSVFFSLCSTKLQVSYSWSWNDMILCHCTKKPSHCQTFFSFPTVFQGPDWATIWGHHQVLLGAEGFWLHHLRRASEGARGSQWKVGKPTFFGTHFGGSRNSFWGFSKGPSWRTKVNFTKSVS